MAERLDDVNLYQYALNDPLNVVDPTGMEVGAAYRNLFLVDGGGQQSVSRTGPMSTGEKVIAGSLGIVALPIAAVAGYEVGLAALSAPATINAAMIGAGEIAAGDALGGAAAGYTLYRIVDGNELADIAATGAFRASPNGDSVKRFLGNRTDAKALREKFEKFFGEGQHIVEGRASQSAMDAAERTQFNDVGRSMELIGIPNEKLDQVKVMCTGSRIARDHC